jgi:hypothetical protein
MEQTNNIVRNWLLGIGVALVALVGVTFLVHRDGTPIVAETNTDATTSTVAMVKKPTNHGAVASNKPIITTTGTGESLAVHDQLASDMVSVSPITITRPTWVAVRGQNGWILGAGLYFAGDTSASISLLRSTIAGEKYDVVMFVDDGDKTFDLHKDMLVDGVSSSFVAN